MIQHKEKEKEKEIVLAGEQLKMENTQISEEKRTGKNEKVKLQDVDKVKTDHVNKLIQWSDQLQKFAKERGSPKSSIADEKIDNVSPTEDVQTQMKSLRSNVEELTKKVKEKDTRILQLQQELVELTEDRSDLQNILKNLNEQVAYVTEMRQKMDADFGKINEDKITLKTEVREWQRKYEKLEKETKSTLDLEQTKWRELNDKYDDLNKTYNDIKYEIARKDEEIFRLKVDMEQLQGDLQTELKEKK